jgi:hypothetical protein
MTKDIIGSYEEDWGGGALRGEDLLAAVGNLAGRQ